MFEAVVTYAPTARVRVDVHAVRRTNFHLHPNALEIVYVLQGALHVRVSSEEFDLDAGDFAVLNRRDPHMLDGSDDNVTAVVHLDLAAFRDTERFCEAIVFACESFDLARYRRQESLLRGVLLDMIGAADAESLDRKGADLIRLLCSGYSLEHYYNRDQAMTAGQREKLLRIVEFVRANLGRRDVLGAVAADQHYSKSYVSHLVKDVMATSFSDFVTALRVMAAESMLLASDATTLEISNACGYSDVKYFTRTFTDWYKQTPAEYRARFRPEMLRDNEITVCDDAVVTELVREHQRGNEAPTDTPRLSITPLLLKNVGSRVDLFDKVRNYGADHHVGARSADPTGERHLVPIRVAAADLDSDYLLDGLTSFTQINATPCLVLEFAGRNATAALVAAVAERLRGAGVSDVTIWLVYSGLHARAAVDQVIATARDDHHLAVQAILMA